MAEPQQQKIDTAWAYGFPSVKISAECGRKIDAVAAKKGMRRCEIVREAFLNAENKSDEKVLRNALEQYLQQEL